MRLYDDQIRAVDQLRDSIRKGHKRPLIWASTAFGKTIVTAEIVKRLAANNKGIWICVDAISLLDQTVAKLVQWGLPAHYIGVFQADHPETNIRRQVQVVSTQTLARRRPPYTPDYVFVDEAHVQHEVIRQLMAEWPDVVFVGLSATPWSKGLGLMYDDLIQPITMAELIEQERLSSYVAYGPDEPDMKGVPVRNGDYADKQSSAVMREEKLVANVVDTWKAKGQNYPTLCFCVDRAHARVMTDRFNAAGVPAEYIDANVSMVERQSIEERMRRGITKVVANIGCLTKGVDWSLGCIILARPTKSEMLLVQMLGRGLRDNRGDGLPYPAIVLDHSGSITKLGYPETISKPTLCTKKKGEKAEPVERTAPLPKPCPSCQQLKPPGMKRCPCGFVPKPQSAIEEAEGELVMLKRPKQGDMLERDTFYREMRGLAVKWKKQDGWAWHVTRDRFGAAPKAKLEPLPPSPETIRWVQSRAIRRNKGRKAA